MTQQEIDMTNDTISRQATIDAFWKLDIELRPSAIDAITDMLKTLPSAQPDLSSYSDKLWKAAYERGKAEARLRGRWRIVNDGFYVCDQCGEPCAGEYMGKPRDRFCKWCGADMRGEQDGQI